MSISSPLIKGLFTYLYFASTAPTAAKRRQSASVCCIVLRHPSELHRPTSICHASISVMTEDCWRLDPTRFPQRIDLELSGALMDDLERLSASTGRPIRDLAADLLSQAIADQGQTILISGSPAHHAALRALWHAGDRPTGAKHNELARPLRHPGRLRSLQGTHWRGELVCQQTDIHQSIHTQRQDIPSPGTPALMSATTSGAAKAATSTGS